MILSQNLKLCRFRGITCNDKHYNLALSDAVVCDTPARAFVKNVKGHAGYFGCDKCMQEGKHVKGRMTFPETSAKLRTDNSFRTKANEEHHLSSCPFTSIKVDMIRNFPLDYMHLTCLGVVRRLLYLWIKGPLETRLDQRSVKEISHMLVLFSEQIPSEFARKPRSVEYLDRWKATELRQFLLYAGMNCLQCTE